jgi:hypothetical protein
MKNELIKFQKKVILAHEFNEDGVAINTIAKAMGLYTDSAGRAIKNDTILGPEHVDQAVQVGKIRLETIWMPD